MKVINVITRKIEEIDEKKLVSFKKKTADYIISIPHSGLFIPLKFKDKFNIGRELLIGSDLHTNKLYKINRGFEIIFNLNSYLINVSRFRDENKNKLLPKHLQNDPFHSGSLTEEKILLEEYSKKEKNELLKYYDIYHNKLQEAINEMKNKKGYALIFDCHSMNSIALKNTPDEGKERDDFNIGTLDDTSASEEIISSFMKNLKKKARSYTIKKNSPYKGGFITMKYADPKNDVHIIQIETKKSLFMHEGLSNEKGSFKIKEKGLKEINLILSRVFENVYNEL